MASSSDRGLTETGAEEPAKGADMLGETGPVILSVDDDENDALFLRTAFKKLKSAARLEIVMNGADALAYIKRGEQPAGEEKNFFPDVVLIDLKMPGMDGFEVLRRIQECCSESRPWLVVFSSSSHDKDVPDAYKAGCDAYLVKPTGYEELRKLMAGLVAALNSGDMDLLTQSPFYRAKPNG